MRFYLWDAFLSEDKFDVRVILTSFSIQSRSYLLSLIVELRFGGKINFA